MALYDRIFTEVMEQTDPLRRQHVCGCIETAERLSHVYGADTESCRLAALLHDCTKAHKKSEQLKICREYDIIIPYAEPYEGSLLHAVTGAALARINYGVEPEIESAIRWHTTGRPGMSLTEKIIFVADCIEPNRDYPGVENVRAAVNETIDRAVFIALRQTLEDLVSRGRLICTDTVEAYNYYLF
jgi:nicotinate-nucleotide adenylyltransferase